MSRVNGTKKYTFYFNLLAGCRIVGGFYVACKWYQIHVLFQPFGCLIVGN